MYKSTFMGLNTALRGVLAQQTALDVTGHNIANLNTEGYSRQRAEMVTTTPWSSPALSSQVTPGQLGTGVEVTYLERLRDKYVDGNARIQFGQQATSQADVEQLQQVEAAFGEPGPNGLSALMRNFFSAMDKVAAHPGDMGARRAFAQAADAMAEGFRTASANLTAVSTQSQTRLVDTTGEINNLSQRIAALNEQIRDAKWAGQQPNDLLDTRDRLMDDLSKLTNYSYSENANGEVTITLGTTTPINLVDPSVPPGYGTITVGDLDNAYLNGDLTAGLAFADERLVNTTIPAQLAWLDTLATELANGVNAQHQAGFDLQGNPGIAVFEPGGGAANMSLLLVPPAAANILTDASLVAAADSAGAQPGNGQNFINMFGVRGAPVAALGGASWEGFYQSSIAGLGALGQAAQRNLANRDMLVEMAQSRRSQVSGVSLDEEMSNMLRFQHAYNASARVMTTMDEALDTLINRMGRVGYLMAIRVTQHQMSANFQGDLQSVMSKMARSQRDISSGERIHRPSDDPFGTSQVIGFDAQLADVESYKSNVSHALGFLNTADSALDGVGKAMQRIRDLVVQASNGTNDQKSLNSIAAEITQLKEAVRDSINGRFGAEHLFSGTTSGTAPYPAPANGYAGNTTAMNRRVSPGLTIAMNMDGPSVLGTTTGPAPGQMNTLDLIDQIVNDIQAGTPASLAQLRGPDLAALDARFDQVLQARTTLGSTAARLETTQEQLGDLEERLMSARSNIADVDLAKAYVEYQNQQTMYQAALAAGSRIMQTSILDYI